MKNKDRIIKHYDNASDGYNAKFESGLLANERIKERRALFSLLNPKPGEKILDAGSGSGFDAKRLRDMGCLVTGIDCSPKMINNLKMAGVEGVVGDLEAFRLSRTFDKVICSGALEFVNDLKRVLKNIHKHLVPGGIVVVLIPKKNLIGYLYKLYHLFFNRIRISLRSRKILNSIISETGFINAEFHNSSRWVYAIKFTKK